MPSRATPSLRLLGALLLTLSACSERGEGKAKDPKSAEAQGQSKADSDSELAPFALSYKAQPSETLIASAQAAVRAEPKSGSNYRDLAEAFLVRKRETADAKFFALAKDAMAAAQRLSPKDLSIRTSAVQLLFTDHRFEEAAQETKKIISAAPNDATAHLLLSDAYVELGKYEEAAESLESAMDISPDLRVYARGSYLRWLDGDKDGAIELITDAIKMGSATSEAVAWCYVELGMLHWHAGELDKAEAVAHKANSLVVDYPAAIELKARIEASRGNADKAIVLYSALLTRRPTVAAHIALSELLAGAGKAAEAQAQRQKAEAMAVHDPLALALHDARHGLSPKETLGLAAKALAERSNLYTQDAHSLALLRAGQAEAAKSASPVLTEFGGIDPTLWLHKGLIQLALDERAEAKDSLDKALALNRHVDPKLVTELRDALTKEVPK